MFLSLEAFLARLGDELGLPESMLQPDALLLDDLGFDSLELFRLAVFCEMLLSGFEMPLQFAIEDIRLRDIHHYLNVHAGHRLSVVADEASANATG